MKKVIASLLVVVCLFSTSVFSVYAEQTSTDPAEYLSANGILTGSNGDLMLDSYFTVEQLMVILARLTGEEEIAKNYKKLTTFTDVPKTAWSQPFIAWAQNKGLMAGSGGGKSGYLDTVTAQRLVAFMLRILGYTDIGWNDVFTYGKNLGLLNLVGTSPNDKLTRNQMAKIVYQTLGTNIKNGTKLCDKLGLKDVTASTKSNNSGAELEPSDVADMIGPAVCYIEVNDSNNKPFATGSGFVINKTGTIVTNYHVIDGAYSATVKFTNGSKYPVSSVLAYDKNRDIAILKITGSNLTSVTLGDSSLIKTGQKILTIGSPEGLENTISDGLISNKERTIEGQKYIQISAPISHGSSGGVLLNYKGEVIGITCAYYSGGQNLNLAIPINDLKPFINTNINKSLSELSASNKPGAPQNVRVSVFDCTVNVGWDQISNADGYRIYCSKNINGPYVCVDNDDYGGTLFHWYPKDYSAYYACSFNDTKEYIKVSAVVNGIESECSQPVVVTIPAPRYFPKMSDVPQPVGTNYYTSMDSDEKDMVAYVYDSLDIESYIYYLESAGFTEADYSASYVLYKGSSAVIIKEYDSGDVYVGGYIR